MARLRGRTAGRRDEWRADGLTFTVYSPFGSIPDPAADSAEQMREGLLPAVVARLVLDNTKGTETKTAMFALNHARPGDADIGRRSGRGAAGICLPARGGRCGGAVGLDDRKKGGGAVRSRLYSCGGQRATGFARGITRCICWGRARDSGSKCRRERSMG